MIKFFRRIRFDLMEKNKTSKYFKYAIGEIVLVVVGILLALQINNWNETKKLEKLKVVYIDKLIKDLKADIINSNNNKAETAALAQHGKFIIETITKNKPIIDKNVFIMKLQQTGRVNFPNLANNTFLDLQTSGNLKLFKNDDLVEALRSYYKSDVDFWREAYISRTAEGLLPKVVEIIPFDVQEKIMNNEIERHKTNTIYDIENPEDLNLSEEQFEDILQKLKTRDDLNFHLKNSTRAHMLQIRYDMDMIKNAMALINLLEETKVDD